MNNSIRLTSEERIILKSFESIMDGLAAYLGSSYELTLHSLEDLEHSVIKILNGFHTGRKKGSPITDLALRMLDQVKADDNKSDYLIYFSRNQSGELLKSTTIVIRGKQNRIIGLLCINFYLGTSLVDYISDLIPHDASAFASETFAESSSSIIAQEVHNAKELIYHDATILPSLRNKKIIQILRNRQIFDIKNAVEIVAKELNISINTVYFHLRNLSHKDVN